MAAPMDPTTQQQPMADPNMQDVPLNEKPAADGAGVNGTTPAANKNSPIDGRDLGEWKGRLNEVLAKPSEHVKSKSPEGAQPWKNSFFGCFSPIDLCCMTWCLPCITFGKTHHRLRKNGNLEGWEPINTSCLLFYASTCFCLHWVPLSLQRADIRTRYNLKGSCMVDIATACCCGCCDLVQQEKESKEREALIAQHQQNGPGAEQYRPAEGMTYEAPPNPNP